MEAVGAGFVSSIGELVVEKLAAYLEQQVKLVFGIDGELKFIKDEIAMATALLKEKSTIDNNSSDLEGAWVKQVRDLIYEAEDVLDEYTYHIARGERNSSSSSRHGSSVVLSCCSTLVNKFHLKLVLRNLRARRQIASNLSKLKLKAKDVKKRRLRYAPSLGRDDVVSTLDNGNIFFDSRFRALSLGKDELVGITHQRDEIVERLVADDDKVTMAPELRVISIVGPGGVGKTTLAMQCFEVINEQAFPCRAQVTVSRSFDHDKLLKNLFRQFFDVDAEPMDKVNLVKEIKNRLEDKRYLVLLDDVWTQDAWNALKTIFPENGQEGSRIIVTTRNDEVASIFPRFVHRIQPLSLEQSRELFRRRAFPVPPFSCPPYLNELMEGILEKCSGMPLAIVTVAGILVTNRHNGISSREHWQRVRDGIGREQEDVANRVRQILMLSYNDLPDDVKPCFLYLSVLPEDYPFKRPNIMRRWIAEGLVVSRGGGGGEAAEEIAKSNFDQLVSRNLIYPARVFWGEVKEWRIHDMMHEIIVRKAIDESFACVINNNNDDDDDLIRRSQPKIRRISVHKDVDLWDTGRPPLDLSLVRSLSFFKDEARSGILTNYFKEMRLVRMLHLGGCRNIQDHHVEQICESLLLLKYLDLSSTGITKLPESIGMLQHLEVLDIRHASSHDHLVIKLPGSLIKLERLSHLYATGVAVHLPRGLGSSGGMGARLRVLKLGKIDEGNMGNLKELSRGQLVRLQALEMEFTVADTASENSLKEMLRATLENLSNSLRSLKLACGWFPTAAAAGFLDDLSLSSPPSKLESLRLREKSLHTRIPSWIASLQHVAKMFLELRHLKGVQYFIKHLGKSLQSLIILRLQVDLGDGDLGDGALTEADFTINIGPEEGFSRLKIFSLRYTRFVAIDVMFPQGALPNLEFLGIGNAVVRHVIGLHHLAKLKEVACFGVGDIGAAAEAHPNKPKLTLCSPTECIIL